LPQFAEFNDVVHRRWQHYHASETLDKATDYGLQTTHANRTVDARVDRLPTDAPARPARKALSLLSGGVLTVELEMDSMRTSRRGFVTGAVSPVVPTALALRLLLGALFIVHLYWKLAILPGGLNAWWGYLRADGYPAVVGAYVLSAELFGALLLIPGVLTRYVAVYAMPMMIGAVQYWLQRKGFFFAQGGAELPLGIQAMAGDGAPALVRSPHPRRVLESLRRRSARGRDGPVQEGRDMPALTPAATGIQRDRATPTQSSPAAST
jgi:putative oxidoreductase